MKNKLTYFICRSSMFGIGYFLLFKYAGIDAWIAVLLGTLLGIGIIYAYKNIKNYFKNKDIRNTLKNTYLGKFYLFIFYLFYIYLITIILVLLPMFVNSFYLLYTPKIIIVVPFLLLAIYLTFKKKVILETISKLLCLISIVIIIIYGLFLTKYIDFSNIKPIFATPTFSILKAALIYALITSVPQILTINYNSNSFKNDLKDYLLANLFTFIICISTILSLGDPLIKIYSFPEYAVLKQIKILDFIENTENLATFIWYFDLFITLATLTSDVKDVLPKKYNIGYFLGTLIIVVYLANYFISSNYRFIITVFYSYPFILGIFFLIFLTLLIYISYSKKLAKEKNTQN